MTEYNDTIHENMYSSKGISHTLVRNNRHVVIDSPPAMPEPTCSPKSSGLLQYVDYDTSVIPEHISPDEGFALYMSVNGGPFEIYSGSDFIDLPAMFAKKIPSNLPLPNFYNNDNIAIIGYGADGVGATVNTWNTPSIIDPAEDGGVVKRFNIVIKPIPDATEIVDMFIAFDGHESGQVEIETCLGYFPGWIDRPVPRYVEPLPPLVEDNSFKNHHSYIVDGQSVAQGLDISWIFQYSDTIESKQVTYDDDSLGSILMAFGFPGIGYNFEMSNNVSLDVGHKCSHYSLLRSTGLTPTDEFADYMITMFRLSGIPVSDELIAKYDLFTDYVKSKYNFVKEPLTETEVQIVLFALDETSANLLIDVLVTTYAQLRPESGQLAVRSSWNVQQKKVLYKLVDKPDMIEAGSENGFEYIKPLMVPANTPLHLKSNWVINFTGDTYTPTPL